MHVLNDNVVRDYNQQPTESRLRAAALIPAQKVPRLYVSSTASTALTL